MSSSNSLLPALVVTSAGPDVVAEGLLPAVFRPSVSEEPEVKTGSLPVEGEGDPSIPSPLAVDV
jgi:hypothetical protein